MTCRAPMLAGLLAVVYSDVPPEPGACNATADFTAVLPEFDGVQVTATVCVKHAEGLARIVDGVRLIKRRT